MGASDTYTAGGFNIYPANIQSNNPQIPYFDIGILSGVGITQAPQTWSPQVTVSPGGVATVKFVQGGYDNNSPGTTPSLLTYGFWSIGVGQTLVTVTGLSGLNSATPVPINVNLTDNCGGAGVGGTGVWAQTVGVGKINIVSPTAIAVTTTAGGPAGGGTLVYDIPATGQGLAAEIPAATSVAGAVMYLLLFGY